MQIKDVKLSSRDSTAFPYELVPHSRTLSRIAARGALVAGISTGIPGLSNIDDDGNASGFDVDFAKALSAALFVDGRACSFAQIVPSDRFIALREERIDLGLCNASRTWAREIENDIVFPITTLVDGETAMVWAKHAGRRVEAWPDIRIAAQRGTTTKANLKHIQMGIAANVVEAETLDAAIDLLRTNIVDAVVFDGFGLAGARSKMKDRDSFVILPQALSREMMGPYVPLDDPVFARIVVWTLFTLVALGEGRKPILPLWRDDPHGACRTEAIGLMVGDYNTMFDRNLGGESALGVAPGVNATSNRGGILLAPGF